MSGPSIGSSSIALRALPNVEFGRVGNMPLTGCQVERGAIIRGHIEIEFDRLLKSTVPTSEINGPSPN